MRIIKALKHSALMALVLSLAVGCATAPTQEQQAAQELIAQTEIAIQEAQAGGYMHPEAANLLAQAREALEAGDEALAIELANKAQQYLAAQKAILEAREALRQAQEQGAAWRDTEELINQAEAALQRGDTAAAIQLANQARRQAETAILQAQREQQPVEVEQPRAAAPVADQYTVMRGDNLWNISAKDRIYGNPYQWPLIYRANAGRINDPDLIYPGQVFDIPRDLSTGEIEAAVRHARNRGAWSLGVVEESDQAYLRQSR